MLNIKKFVINDLNYIKDDITKHIIYTLFIIIISTLLTFTLLFNIFNKKTQNVKTVIRTVEKMVVVPQQGSSYYIERGSPYDNRTVGTVSANVIFHGPRDKNKIALTFDAEMTDSMKADLISGRVKSSYDKRIIDTLISTNTKATLFLTGMWIELYPQVTEQLSKNSLFEFGSHSYSDTSYYGFCYGLSELPPTLRIEDIGATEKLLREHAHIDNQLFRFPGGCYAPDDVKLVNEANDTVVHWDVVGNDGFNQNANQVFHNVVDNVRNGSIIILHLNGFPNAPKTAEALPLIISNLKSRGYEFVKVSELLNLPPEQVSN